MAWSSTSPPREFTLSDGPRTGPRRLNMARPPSARCSRCVAPLGRTTGHPGPDARWAGHPRRGPSCGHRGARRSGLRPAGEGHRGPDMPGRGKVIGENSADNASPCVPGQRRRPTVVIDREELEPATSAWSSRRKRVSSTVRRRWIGVGRAGSVWATGDWSINTGNGFSGGLQFTVHLGGLRRPRVRPRRMATREQIAVARRSGGPGLGRVAVHLEDGPELIIQASYLVSLLAGNSGRCCMLSWELWILSTARGAPVATAAAAAAATVVLASGCSAGEIRERPPARRDTDRGWGRTNHRRTRCVVSSPPLTWPRTITSWRSAPVSGR